MKYLMLLLFLSLSLVAIHAQSPQDFGHFIMEVECECETPFKDTDRWSVGSRGGYYCMATSKKTGKKYKRYFSSWRKAYGDQE